MLEARFLPGMWGCPRLQTASEGSAEASGALLTVSDKAMHTNVNFLMWLAVTVVLVLASLLLGLFWGK